MNVLLVICDGGWMSDNLAAGWKRLGAHTEEFFYGTHMGKSWTRPGLLAARDVNATLLLRARALKAEGRLDLIFAVIYDDVLDIHTAKELRRLNVPMVNFHVDLVGQWYRVLNTGRYFDRVACAQRDHWDGLRRAGIRPYFMPMAANPSIFAEDWSGGHDGVLYLGSPSPYRIRVLRALLDAGVNLEIRGNNWFREDVGSDVSTKSYARKTLHDVRHYLWPRLRDEGPELLRSVAARFSSRENDDSALPLVGIVRGRYTEGEFPRLVRGAAMNLGFTHFRGIPGSRHERRQTRLRDFQIPMAGGFYVAQACPELDEFYVAGTHIVTWEDERDLLEKIRYYETKDAECVAIARSGQQHALENHTWTHRFRGLMREIGIAQN